MSSKRVQLKQIYKPKCRRCDLHEDAKRRCTQGKGPIKAGGIFIIHEDPWELTGARGRLFYKLLDQAEIEPKEVFITYAVKCVRDSKTEPTKVQLDNCHTYLIREVNLLNPRVIVNFSPTYNTFVYNRRVTVSGDVYKLEWGQYKGRYYLLSESPSQIMRHGSPSDLKALKCLQIAKDIGVEGNEYELSRGFFEYPELQPVSAFSVRYSPGYMKAAAFKRPLGTQWDKVFDRLYQLPGHTHLITHPSYREPARVRHVLKSAWMQYRVHYKGARLHTKLAPVRGTYAWIEIED